MPQKKRPRPVSPWARDAVENVKSAFSGLLFPAMSGYAKDAVRTGQSIAYYTHDIMLVRLYNSLLLIVGLLLVAGSLMTFLEIRLNVPREVALLGLGILMIACSLYIKGWVKQRQYYPFDEKQR